MTLLTFPPSPSNGQLYPASPLPGQNQYQWEAGTSTWRLLGAATSVIPGCYGDAYTVPSFCVNAQGQIESVTNVTIVPPGGTVTDVTAGVGLLGGTITVSGTIDLDTAYTDTLYLGLAGGTMTGDIVFSGTQTFPSQDLDTVTTAGNTTANSIDIGGLTASGLTYPAADGLSGDVLVTDGAGSLSFITPPTVDLQWVTNNGAVTTDSIDVGGLTSAGLIYPLADGSANEVMTTDGAGNLAWSTTLKVVTAPGSQSAPGNPNEVSYNSNYFYWYDGTNWQRVAAGPGGW